MDKKRRNSLIFGVICVVVATAAGNAMNAGRKTGSQIVVWIDGVEEGRYPLNIDREIEIGMNGTEEGKNVIQIHNGKADMIEADCPDQLCVNQKEIGKTGEIIVCLPHKLVVEVEGKEDSDLDAIVS